MCELKTSPTNAKVSKEFDSRFYHGFHDSYLIRYCFSKFQIQLHSFPSMEHMA